MLFTHLKFFLLITHSNRHQLIKTFAFYTITSILLFFVLVLNSSLSVHVSKMFPREVYVTAMMNNQDVSHRIFTQNNRTVFNQNEQATLIKEPQQQELMVIWRGQEIVTPYTISCCMDTLSVSEYFVALYPLSVGDLLLIQNQVFRIEAIHHDASPLILPMNSDLHLTEPKSVYKLIDTDLEDAEILALLHHHFGNTVHFELLTFDIEDALLTILNLGFGVLLLVGIVVLLVASFNVRSMTMLSITKRQRDIALYYLFGYPKKDLFILFQIESFCIQSLALASSYLLSVVCIFFLSLLFNMSFNLALFPAGFMALMQILFVQVITHKILNQCIHESIAKI